MTLRYGIYPGGRAGTVSSGPTDPNAAGALIERLAGSGSFLVREYVHFLGRAPDPGVAASLGALEELSSLTFPDAWYQEGGRELDLVVSYIPPLADLPGWLAYLDAVIDRYGHLVSFLQVTLEPNFAIPLIDGSAPGVLDALTKGLPHARRRLRQKGLNHVAVGFSVAEPAEWLGGDDPFWAYLEALPADVFAGHVDYVGLGLYPDAFSPVAPAGQPGDLASLTREAVEHLRRRSLPRAHIPDDVPIHIAESGSPSGAPRGVAAQAESIATMIGVIEALEVSHNVTHYELFSLRDADSASDQPVATLGLVTTSYETKPAFETYRQAVHRSHCP
ncbi:hypothetical protein AKJ09_05002 [Labilithrix luteola]|uniref:Uncharacterized protein n=1 Tax=Labilithrix luteola TaxID=1391654 RepID=A0A0K1PXT8_9BACT|nr:hypothetical protein [Labilithrix luteola]AKU98338.1 hypothetical protein AKJ09_05002 [Labilithrix luteola]